MTATIENNSVVSMHYTLTDDDGTVLDSSEGNDPLTYLHGAQNIIPGLENALTGKGIGDELRVRVEPSQAYGEFDPGMVQTVDRSVFQGVDEIDVGMVFQAQSPGGVVQQLVVTEVNGNNITIDGNHPLAGVPLTFDVKVTGVRAASDEEIAHGHAH
ncbi:MAG: peptidylprolyl isomerase [Chloroflexota bacterium]